MRSQRVSPLLAFALLPAFSTGTASNGAARSLTLDAAIDLALEKNEGILIAEITAQTDYRTAHTEMARATGALLEQRGIDVDTTP